MRRKEINKPCGGLRDDCFDFDTGVLGEEEDNLIIENENIRSCIQRKEKNMNVKAYTSSPESAKFCSMSTTRGRTTLDSSTLHSLSLSLLYKKKMDVVILATQYWERK